MGLQMQTQFSIFDVIGEDVEMAGFCVSPCTWEQEVAEPALNDLGYSVEKWVTGEYDSFGPLSRIAHVIKDGVRTQLIYG